MISATMPLAPWCRKRWITMVNDLNIRAELRDTGGAFVRRSTTLTIWTVQGKLKGSAGRETFTLTFPLLGRGIWAKQIIPGIVRRPGLLAQLLVGVIPEEIEEVFAEAGTTLIPSEPLSASCTCCMFAPRLCKHHVAALLHAAQLFHQDPLSLIEMRGMKRSELQRLLGEAHHALLAEHDTAAQHTDSFALPIDPRLFWQGVPYPSSLPEIAEPPELFIWQLRQPDFVGSTSLAHTFEYVYRAARDANRTYALPLEEW